MRQYHGTTLRLLLLYTVKEELQWKSDRYTRDQIQAPFATIRPASLLEPRPWTIVASAEKCLSSKKEQPTHKEKQLPRGLGSALRSRAVQHIASVSTKNSLTLETWVIHYGKRNLENLTEKSHPNFHGHRNLADRARCQCPHPPHKKRTVASLATILGEATM